ncbi:MAG: hypothetical protein ACK5PB_14285 [Pirellula sp.]|jgi:hypothetical protein
MDEVEFCPFAGQTAVLGNNGANDAGFGPTVAVLLEPVIRYGKGTPSLSIERTDGQLNASTKEEISNFFRGNGPNESLGCAIVISTNGLKPTVLRTIRLIRVL